MKLPEAAGPRAEQAAENHDWEWVVETNLEPALPNVSASTSILALPQVVLGKDGSVQLKLSREALPILGQVVDDLGEPIPSFQIDAYPASDVEALRPDLPFSSGPAADFLGPKRHANFGSPDGGFAFAGFQGGPWCLWVHAEGHANQLIEDVQPGTDPLRIVLPRKGTVHGSVRGPKGEATSGSYVRLAQVGSSYSIRAMAQPEFDFPNVDPGTLRISSETYEYLPWQPFEVELLPGQDLDLGELRIGLQGLIRVSVSPVYLGRALEATVSRVVPGGLEQMRREPVPLAGYFVIEGLDPGTYEIEIHEPFEGFPTWSPTLWASELGLRRRVDLQASAEVWVRLEPEAGWVRIEGRVVDHAEATGPWRVSFVALSGAPLQPPVVVQCLSTDPEGRFAACLPPHQKLFVLARQPAANSQPERIVVLDGSWSAPAGDARVAWSVPRAAFSVRFETAAGEQVDGSGPPIQNGRRYFPAALGEEAAAVSAQDATPWRIDELLPGLAYGFIAKGTSSDGTSWITVPNQQAVAPAAGETQQVVLRVTSE
ncbi:MAG: hypothetical protein H6830_08020 [Planctomycetes bacterium]|nr:hypothetical protein [Planctomycetota bacterium]MCB9909777.1 hypothetical protein [Planctomycetota bacterium]MCB9912314.1 hypothetical protein [Planctomycetota bacterium]HRV80315.1 hypothetical protein [Planctomycetota bacterium]